LWIDYVKNVLLAGVKGEQEKWDFKPHTIGYGDHAILNLTDNLVDMQIYLRGNMNLNDDEKITLMVNLKTSVATEFSSIQSAE
jgi:hypothetical protein